MGSQGPNLFGDDSENIQQKQPVGVVEKIEEVTSAEEVTLEEDAGTELAVTKEIDVPEEDNTENETQENTGENEEAATEEVEEVEEKTVKTASLVVGIIADVHYEPSYCVPSVYTFASRMRSIGADFVIELGDFVHNRDDGILKHDEAVADFNKINASYAGFSPRYYVYGNHEALSLNKKDFKNLTGYSSYYSFRSGDYNIIVLDSNYDSDNDDIEPKHDDVSDYRGRIPKDERTWLKGKLSGHSKNIIFIHHPIYNLSNEDEIEDILDKYDDNVIFIASGHEHRASKKKLEGIDYYDIPSLCYQKQYAVVEVNGKKPEVSFVSL